MVLDTGEPWEIEEFQRQLAKDVLSGKRAIWVVIPEGNGKTTLMAGLALYHLDPEGWGVHAPFVVVSAATREQAEWLYLQAEGMVFATPGMKDRFKCLSGFRRINRRDGGGRIQIFAADDRTADGAIFTLAIIDELHNHRDLKLYRRWNGKIDKRGGQLLTISTAGEPASDFEDTRAEILRDAGITPNGKAHIRAETDNVILHDWAVRDREKIDDMRAVKKANPLSSITPESLRRKREDATMTDAHFMRFSMNIASRLDGMGVPPELWDSCADPSLKFKPGTWTIGGWDMAWEVDTAALVVVGWEDLERRPVVAVRVYEPPVDEADVVKGLVELQKEYEPVGWVFDPYAGAKQMSQQLEKGQHPNQAGVEFEFIEHSQKPTPMAEAAVRLDEAIRRGYLVHDGNETLRHHVLSAVKKKAPAESWRFDRPPEVRGGTNRRQQYPIDALTALLMAHSVAVAEKDKPDAVPLVAARPR